MRPLLLIFGLISSVMSDGCWSGNMVCNTYENALTEPRIIMNPLAGETCEVVVTSPGWDNGSYPDADFSCIYQVKLPSKVNGVSHQLQALFDEANFDVRSPYMNCANDYVKFLGISGENEDFNHDRMCLTGPLRGSVDYILDSEDGDISLHFKAKKDGNPGAGFAVTFVASPIV